MSKEKAEKPAKGEGRKIGTWVGIGAAGIGSAAIVAALLYTRRARKTPPAPKGPVDPQD